MKGSMDVGTISSVLKSCITANTSFSTLRKFAGLKFADLIWQKKCPLSIR